MDHKNFAGPVGSELNINRRQVETVITLLDEGATVPFIARYRKEATGELDEVQIMAIRDLSESLLKFDTRKKSVLKSLEEQGVLTGELKKKIENSGSLPVLEDLYLPYKPKRKTRASVAKERGLAPLGAYILNNQQEFADEAAAKYINPEIGLSSTVEVLSGARDIIAEGINENSELRSELRAYFEKYATFSSKLVKGKDGEKDGLKYRDYFSWSEIAGRTPSHRILAIFRGAEKGILKFSISIPEEDAFRIIRKYILKVPVSEKKCSDQIFLAVKDSFKRLLAPSMETEMKNLLKKRGDAEAIRVFGSNLSELLMEAPLGEKRVLAVDPGLRTGCKIVCLDSSGKLLKSDTVYPLPPVNRLEEALKKMQSMVEEFSIEAIAVGNGTGGREALSFCRSLNLGDSVIIASVNENGASVYSASEAGREEFPDYDLTVRGAVSIGRRLMDPLSELIKIDPKSIGVGQYQHDVDQKELKKSLDDVVVSCVNRVGVEINTASKRLLQYVSGLSPRLAASIVNYRDTKGAYCSRSDILSVPGMGKKSFEQGAGFLRVGVSPNPLDNSAVHPESYHIVERMAGSLGVGVADLIGNNTLVDRLDPEKFIDGITGLPTVRDIIDELKKPGRDPRLEYSDFSFAEGIDSVSDLKEGMVLPGIITNVTNFGAFTDIGVHQDGLIHISQLADRFVKNPMDIVKVNQKVMVRVMS
ncbi:MAG: RNA-binding transcriptional accessory protein, partial [Spirochaetales bacterium]|nr:RNA-binding transcriptional accessory protein [Spirochaetales bacterium]